jgi:effector-binding domain-containing protein
MTCAPPGHPTLVAATGVGETSIMAELVPEIVVLEPQDAIAVRGDVKIADLPGFFERAFREAAEAAGGSGVEIVGPPFGFYPEMPTETVAVEAGFPVSAPVEAQGNAHRIVLPGGRAVQAVHVGPYDTMEKSYDQLQSWMAENDLQPAAEMWEWYLSDPQVERNPANWQTRIVWPIA